MLVLRKSIGDYLKVRRDAYSSMQSSLKQKRECLGLLLVYCFVSRSRLYKKRRSTLPLEKTTGVEFGRDHLLPAGKTIGFCREAVTKRTRELSLNCK